MTTGDFVLMINDIYDYQNASENNAIILTWKVEVDTSSYMVYILFWSLTLSHSERPKLYTILAFPSAIGLINLFQ